MARSIWNGALCVGALDVPVKVFAATEARALSFRELHAPDGATVQHRRYSTRTGEELEREQIVKGFQIPSGKWVLVSDEEVKAAERPARKAIEVEDVVPLEQIDPFLFDRAYHLGAQDRGREAFATLLAALERTDLVLVGRVVLRSREQLVTVRAGDGVMRMSTMRFFDELVPVPELELPEPEREPSRREVEMAGQLVGGMEDPFDPGAYRDEHAERVRGYAAARARGESPKPPGGGPPQDAPDDLERALEQSLGATTKSATGKRSAGTTAKGKGKAKGRGS